MSARAQRAVDSERDSLTAYLESIRRYPLLTGPEEVALANGIHLGDADRMPSLRPRDARVLRLYFGIGSDETMTLEEIGSLLGITRERVRQIRDNALERLRKTPHATALASFQA